MCMHGKAFAIQMNANDKSLVTAFRSDASLRSAPRNFVFFFAVIAANK